MKQRYIGDRGKKSMIITSGLMVVKKNKNSKTTKFFGEVEVGDIIEVKVDLSTTLRYGGGSKMVTVYNHNKKTNRNDAPTHLNAGLNKMELEPVNNEEHKSEE